LRIEKVDESNKQRIIDLLRFDVVHHVLAFYDIQFEPHHTSMYAAFEDESLKGYVLIYDNALDFPSVVLEGESCAAERLLDHAPQNQFIMHVPPDLLQLVKGRFPSVKSYVENWMLVKKDEAKFLRSTLTRRLRMAGDAAKLDTLFLACEERSTGVMKYSGWMGRMPTYGVFLKEELVSCAGSFLQLPQVWMIGGVYTHPNHRNKGYATLATSAVTEEALKNAEAAALFVRSDNYSAIKAYERIGYKKVGEKMWVDVETGRKP